MYVLLILLGLIFIGIPISFSIGLSSLLFLLIEGKGFFLNSIPQTMFSGLDSFPYLSIPCFILAGELMNRTGITNVLIDFVDKIVGHVRGGLAHVNILASVLFAGITGNAVSDTSALGSVEIPMMIRGGYDRKFSTAVTAASSVIGPIIPPSVIMVIYAMVAMNVSIGAMFMAGIVPGILMAGGMMILSYFIAKKRGFPVRERRATIKEVLQAFRKAIIPMIMPIIIIGGILGGVFTATEAAATAVGYALIVGFFILKNLKISDLPEALINSARTTAVVGLLIAFAKVMGWVLTTAQIPQAVGAFFTANITSPVAFLVVTTIIYLIMGIFFDPSAALIVIVPILLPTAMNFGIDPIHFGIITIVALNIGLITPPVGVCLYVSCSIAQIKLEQLVKDIMPFIIVEILTLFLIVFWPQAVLFIPKLLGF